jgi:hypothetical protein
MEVASIAQALKKTPANKLPCLDYLPRVEVVHLPSLHSLDCMGWQRWPKLDGGGTSRKRAVVRFQVRREAVVGGLRGSAGPQTGARRGGPAGTASGAGADAGLLFRARSAAHPAQRHEGPAGLPQVERGGQED